MPVSTLCTSNKSTIGDVLFIATGKQLTMKEIKAFIGMIFNIQIFGMLHVGEIDARYNHSSICNYTPDKQVPVDEAVISFRGRVSFRQYIKEN